MYETTVIWVGQREAMTNPKNHQLVSENCPRGIQRKMESPHKSSQNWKYASCIFGVEWLAGFWRNGGDFRVGGRERGMFKNSKFFTLPQFSVSCWVCILCSWEGWETLGAVLSVSHSFLLQSGEKPCTSLLLLHGLFTPQKAVSSLPPALARFTSENTSFTSLQVEVITTPGSNVMHSW